MSKRTKDNRLLKSVEDDERFTKISTNPLFHEMPKREKKVVIDKRFEQLFTDDRFKLGNFKVDKRGRKFNLFNSDQLSNLYDLEKSDEENSNKLNENKSENEIKNETSQKSEDEKNDSLENEESDENNDFEINLDLARGEGNVSSSSSSDESEIEQDADEPDQEETNSTQRKLTLNSWGEMDRSVKRVEWASNRIAICNLDWNCLKAEDLFLVLNSFKPADSQIFSIEIYLSDFGAEKISKENINGPEIPNLTKEAIRSYELERLQYYYAVCKCDSEDTAVAIYENCDGVEYETSGVRFDIRFIPNDMEFDESRLREKFTIDDLNIEVYKPKIFESFALSNVEAKLTWDETNPERTKLIKKALKEDVDFKLYNSLIASGSDSENEEEIERRKKLLFSNDLTNNTNEEELQIEWESTEKELSINNNINKINNLKESDSDETIYTSDKEEKKKTKYVTKNADSTQINPGLKPEKKITKFQKYLERKKQIRKERKAQEQQLKQKKIENDKETNYNNKNKKLKIKSDDSNQILTDKRFSSLFTDSAFAIDKTHALYKGGNLANRQAQEKTLKRLKVVETNKNL